MYKYTFDCFGRFFDAYTKKGFTKYNEKEAFDELCKAFRIENEKRFKQNEKASEYISKKRKNNPNYARPKNNK